MDSSQLPIYAFTCFAPDINATAFVCGIPLYRLQVAIDCIYNGNVPLSEMEFSCLVFKWQGKLFRFRISSSHLKITFQLVRQNGTASNSPFCRFLYEQVYQISPQKSITLGSFRCYCNCRYGLTVCAPLLFFLHARPDTRLNQPHVNQRFANNAGNVRCNRRFRFRAGE